MRADLLLAAGLFLTAAPAGAQLAAGTFIAASSATISGNLGVGTDAAAAKVDLRGGSLTMDEALVEVFIGSATQTGSVTTGSVQVWSAVTGASVGFTLARTMTVRMQAHGAAYAAPGGHCGFRFTIDGTGQGNVSWGDVLVWSGTGNQWSTWVMEREAVLASGAHTITVQQVGNVASGCTSDPNDYSRARLWLYAR